MTVRIEQHAARVRCYQCGSDGIPALCHHCWRAGCAKHVKPAPGWAERVLGKEGSGTGLERERAYHCADCLHTPARGALAVGAAGITAAAVSLVVVWLDLPAGLALLLVGAVLIGGTGLSIRRRAAAASAGMPMPVRPKVVDLGVLERFKAHISLGDDGTYRTVASPVEGELTVQMTFGGADRERLDRRLAKRSSSADRDLRFSAGRLVLQGPVGIKPEADLPGPVLPLEGRTGSFPVFRAKDPHVSSQWAISRHYRLSAEPEFSSGPVWITPSVVPESDQRALELEIQWVEQPPRSSGLNLDVIDLLRLQFPASWGDVEQVSERAIKGNLPEDPAGQRVVEWRQLVPAAHELQDRRMTLAVRFEQPIDVAKALSGRLEATMLGTLSGISRLRLYGALGKGRNMPRASIKTRMEVDFELSLASIRYQAIRIVPDQASHEPGLGFPREFDVIPDDGTVIELTNALSEQGYYVKRVIENPPRSGARADLVHRYWDIAGRLYEGVYPIDFHMVLTGEEVHRGGVRPEQGTTKVRITVKGAYTNPQMYARVEDEWKTLCAVTANALEGQQAADPPEVDVSRGRPARDRPPPADDRGPAESPPAPDGPATRGGSAGAPAGPSAPAGAGAPNTAVKANGNAVPHPRAAPNGAGIASGHAGAGPPPGEGREAAQDVRLRRYLIKLDEAFVDGKITPGQYEEMKARAEEEFRR